MFSTQNAGLGLRKRRARGGRTVSVGIRTGNQFAIRARRHPLGPLTEQVPRINCAAPRGDNRPRPITPLLLLRSAFRDLHSSTLQSVLTRAVHPCLGVPSIRGPLTKGQAESEDSTSRMGLSRRNVPRDLHVGASGDYIKENHHEKHASRKANHRSES